MPKPTVNNRYIPPDIAEFFSRRMRDVAASINCCLIGTITAINANGTVTVSVNFQKVIKGVIPIPGNIGEMADQVINYPALVDVPVFIYQGGGAAILMPIKVGDTCLILFCDRDMDIWFQTAQIAPPNSERVHNLNDAIALVGINNIFSLFPPNTSGIIQIFDGTGERLLQSGMMVAYGGSTAPSGCLMCHGQAVSRTTYANLFAAIGTAFGPGDGSTTFNVPNMQGNVPVGMKSGDTYFGALGATYGEQTHTLVIGEIPPHTHQYGTADNITPGGGIYGTSDEAFDFATSSVGGGLPHNNIQPSLVVNWLIKI